MTDLQVYAETLHHFQPSELDTKGGQQASPVGGPLQGQQLHSLDKSQLLHGEVQQRLNIRALAVC